MALTAKPISTISYNSKEFLSKRLSELLTAGKIEKYYAIYHDRDTNVSTGEKKKPHFHVWVQPNRRIDTMALANMFIEVDDDNKDHPLKCRPFQSSNLYHWIRYTIHDPIYLELKNDDNDGRTEYSIEDYIAFDRECLQEDYEASSVVVEMNRSQQRDKLADLIVGSSESLDMTLVYEYAKQHGLIEGYFGFQNALASLVRDHNRSLEIGDFLETKLYQQRVKDNVRIGMKLDEADITGTATIKDSQGNEYLVVRKASKRK